MSLYPCHRCYEDKPFYRLDLNGFPVCVDCAEGKNCPDKDCKNEGSYPDHNCNGTADMCYQNCPVQVQCEFCYTVEGSKFILREQAIADSNLLYS